MPLLLRQKSLARGHEIKNSANQNFIQNPIQVSETFLQDQKKKNQRKKNYIGGDYYSSEAIKSRQQKSCKKSFKKISSFHISIKLEKKKKSRRIKKIFRIKSMLLSARNAITRFFIKIRTSKYLETAGFELNINRMKIYYTSTSVYIVLKSLVRSFAHKQSTTATKQ